MATRPGRPRLGRLGCREEAGGGVKFFELNDLVVLSTPVPQCKLDGHWLRRIRRPSSGVLRESPEVVRDFPSSSDY
jgi:hypothetical protein